MKRTELVEELKKLSKQYHEDFEAGKVKFETLEATTGDRERKPRGEPKEPKKPKE